MIELPDNFSWPAAWKPLPFPEGWLGLVRSAEVELRSEVCPGHPLYSRVCRAIAFNADDVNEFLFVTTTPPRHWRSFICPFGRSHIPNGHTQSAMMDGSHFETPGVFPTSFAGSEICWNAVMILACWSGRPTR